MKFDLKRPCPMCPFRTDCLEEWLGKSRASEIAESITVGQATFACHETTTATGDGKREQHCAGALIMLDESGAGVGQLARIAHRTGMWDPDEMDYSAPVFKSIEEFIRHHSREDERIPEGEPCSVCDPGCEAPAGYLVGGAVVDHFVDADLTAECPDCGAFICSVCTCYCQEEEEDNEQETTQPSESN